MPTYLLHQKADGTPIGVLSETHDFYDPEYTNLREAGRELVKSKIPALEWNKFAEIAAGTTPTNGSRFDEYDDASRNLKEVLQHAQRDLEQDGYPEPE